MFSLICGLFIVSLALKSYETPTTLDGKTELENVTAAGIDDANIFFTYARNVARGEGAVYNIGGERVEGFSSPLFTLLCTCILLVTQQVEVMVLLINTALLVTVMVQVQYYLQASVCDSDLSADGNKKDL